MRFFYVLVFLVSSVFSQKKNDNLLYRLQEYKLRNLPINTSSIDFGVNFFNDSTIIFSSTKEIDPLKKHNKNPYLELYQANISPVNEIRSLEKFSMDLHSDFHEANFAFTKDGKYVYFTSGDQNKGKGVREINQKNIVELFGADISNGVITNIKLLYFNNNRYSVGHPFLSKDEKTLYFMSDRPEGYGGTDLYKVDILGYNRYGNIKNLGPKINSPANELYPFVDVDDVLYFSSDKEGGKGGLDVYGISLKDTLQNVFHLPAPVNSNKDDFAFVLSKSNLGFVSSNREGGLGEDDIYKLKLKWLQYIQGTVENVATTEPVSDSKVSIYKNNQKVDEIITDSIGQFQSNIKVGANETYMVKVERRNHLADSTIVKTPEIRYFSNNIAFNLTRTAPDEIVIKETVKTDKSVEENVVPDLEFEPIYFDFDKFNIDKDSELVLDSLVDTLNKYPNIMIEVDSYTDAEGEVSWNQMLSDKRAKSTTDYLILKGISADRIKATGHGESKLINKCGVGIICTKAEKKLNRRTEFRVVLIEK
ncbi:outer membrane protein OmpA-like peptidoglycan-associated protein [Wenyingzhuangia heitensis]|uniref:Outer membrane protein OmpA-like peptidoglycan-associated protein n=1 Tax=Wenyingzhuangia heitensis TaxID=1487859 RepID=A0ABX0U5U7_9FLAO|nr:OmpA family protein [Wenyingzhuangia heitensis]NIJ44220.1 outer membrane protein OmpA-like peptidoglycan-associated protein [Wenyingzhuangia heitensis]